MTELWKEIPGFDGYEASSMGSIRYLGKMIKPFLTGKKKKPYLTILIYREGTRAQKKVHRLVLKAFLGLPQKKQVGCHRDDNTFNNRIENLYWGTQKENVADSVRSGTHRKFEKNNPYVFKVRIAGNVIELIKEDHKSGKGTQREIAKKYNVDPSYVSYLVNGKRRSA